MARALSARSIAAPESAATDPTMYDVANSPFIELATPFTVWEAVKMALFVPTVPVRLCIAVTAIIAVAIVNSIAILGCDLEQPLPRWRRRTVELSSQACCRVFLWSLGFWRPKVIGYHNYVDGQKRGAIGIFNHVSYLDAFVVVWAFCAAGVTFNFSQHLPVLGYGVRALQNLYLPAEDNKAKQQSSMVQLIKARAANPAMPMLSVAPEGTLSHGRCVLKFKTGAFVAGVPVVPILLRYRLAPHNPAWTIIIPFWHVLRMMCQLYNSVTVEILPVYIPNREELADPALYASNIRKLIADTLGVPMAEEDRSHFLALVNARISVSWDGRRIVAPPGVVDKQGMCDLEPYMPANYKKSTKKLQ